MRLFKRDPDELPCCPECRELLPHDAVECAMCGHQLVAPEREGRFARDPQPDPSAEPR